MSTYHLHGMGYETYEIVLPVSHAPKELTKAIRKVLDKNPEGFLFAVTSGCHPDDEGLFIYTVLVADV